MSVRALAAAIALLAGAPSARAQSPWPPRVALHVGTGTGGWIVDGQLGWLTDVLARNPLRLALAAEGDARVSGHFRAGARASTLYLRGGDADTLTSILLGRLEALARFHPRWTAGPYAQAGLGPALMRQRTEVPGLASGTVTSWGGSLSLALGGYVGGDSAPEVRLEAEASAQAWRKAAGGPTVSATFGGTLGFAW